MKKLSLSLQEFDASQNKGHNIVYIHHGISYIIFIYLNKPQYGSMVGMVDTPPQGTQFGPIIESTIFFSFVDVLVGIYDDPLYIPILVN